MKGCELVALGQIHLTDLFGSHSIFEILKNWLLMFKIQKISLKIPDTWLLLKMWQLLTMDLFSFLAVFGLNWLEHVFSNLH